MSDSLIDRLKMVLKKVKQIYPEYPEDFEAKEEAITTLDELIAEQHPTPDRNTLIDKLSDLGNRECFVVHTDSGTQYLVSLEEVLDIVRQCPMQTKGGIMKDEKTNPEVSSKAGRLLHDADNAIGQLRNAKAAITFAIAALEKAKSVAASALTQAEDKKLREFVQQLADGHVSIGRGRVMAKEFLAKKPD